MLGAGWLHLGFYGTLVWNAGLASLTCRCSPGWMSALQEQEEETEDENKKWVRGSTVMGTSYIAGVIFYFHFALPSEMEVYKKKNKSHCGPSSHDGPVHSVPIFSTVSCPCSRSLRLKTNSFRFKKVHFHYLPSRGWCLFGLEMVQTDYGPVSQTHLQMVTLGSSLNLQTKKQRYHTAVQPDGGRICDQGEWISLTHH